MLATNEKLLLVYKNMPYISHARRYDIMLTPQFYIYKKEPLPVKYQYQAAKLAPSILDELTGAEDYDYAAFRDGDGWALIAYDMAKIESFLQEKGLPRHLINKIYFAQQSKEYFKHPVSIDERTAILTVDDTVVMLPKSVVSAEEYGTVTDRFRPDKGIAPSQKKGTFITKRQAVLASILLLLIATGYFVEGLKYKREAGMVDEKIKLVKSKYPQFKNKSSIVLSNIYESNYAIDSVQRRIRDRLKDISRLTSKDSKIDHLKIDTEKYEAMISADKKSVASLKKYAKSKKLTIKDMASGFELKGAL